MKLRLTWILILASPALIAETDENYTCEAGELRAWEANEYQVAKTF